MACTYIPAITLVCGSGCEVGEREGFAHYRCACRGNWIHLCHSSVSRDKGTFASQIPVTGCNRNLFYSREWKKLFWFCVCIQVKEFKYSSNFSDLLCLYFTVSQHIYLLSPFLTKYIYLFINLAGCAMFAHLRAPIWFRIHDKEINRWVWIVGLKTKC